MATSNSAEPGKMNPLLARAITARPCFTVPPNSSYVDHREARAAHLARLRHLMPDPWPTAPIPDQVAEETVYIPAEDGHRIKVIHYRPASSSTVWPPRTTGPLVVLFHEGGWGMGDLSDEEFNARLLTRDLGATCLNVEYRLGPEHKFPTGITDSLTVVQWAAANAGTPALPSADLHKGFILGGSSAGGHIAAILSHVTRFYAFAQSTPITGTWLSVPFIIHPKHVPEKYQPMFTSLYAANNNSDSDAGGTKNADQDMDVDPVIGRLTPESVAAMLENIGIDEDSELFNTLHPKYYPPASHSPHTTTTTITTTTTAAEKEPYSPPKAKLGDAFIQTGGIDPLRDQGTVYSRILREEYGVRCRLRQYDGYGHMFWTNWPELEVSRVFARDMVDGFRWLLSRDDDDDDKNNKNNNDDDKS